MSGETNAESIITAQEYDEQKTETVKSRSLFPPRRLWLFWLCCVLLIAFVRRPDATDKAISNIITLILSFITVMSFLIWYLVYSGYRRSTRIVHAILISVLLVGFLSFFKIDHVTGELIPVYVFRFASAPHELLEKPQDQVSLGKVDLLSTTQNDFPQFLGPHRNGTLSHIRLTTDWESQPPKLLWRKEIGAGWAAFSAVNGYAVTLEQRGDMEMTTCYDIRTGELKWWHETEARHHTVLGGTGPRSTPTIADGRVYTVGAQGMLTCLAGETGKEIWSRDLQQEVNITSKEESRQLPYGRSTSPLVADGKVIVPGGGPEPGKRHSLIAYDALSGEELWRSGSRQISYSSPTLTTLAGKEQILIVNEDSLSSHDLQTGEQLWEHPWPGNSDTNPNNSQPVNVGNDQVFLSKGYSRGSTLVQISRSDEGEWSTEQIWKKNNVMKTKFTNVVTKDGYIYGLDDGIFQCIELKTGKKQWKRGRYGHGQILLVGDLLLVQTERGEIILVNPQPERLQELGTLDALQHKTWNNLCLYGSYLLIRNANEAACYELPLGGN